MVGFEEFSTQLLKPNNISEDVQGKMDSTDRPRSDCFSRVIKYLHEEFPMDETTHYGLIPVMGLACSFVSCGVITRLLQWERINGELEMAWYSCAFLTLCLLEFKWGWNVGKNENAVDLWLYFKSAELMVVLSAALVSWYRASVVLYSLQLCFLAMLMYIVIRKYKLPKKPNVTNA